MLTAKCGLVALTFSSSHGVKKGFSWGPEEDRALKEMKALVLADTLLRYPDLNKPIDIYPDASDY